MELYKVPGVSETLDWVAALVALDSDALDRRGRRRDAGRRAQSQGRHRSAPRRAAGSCSRARERRVTDRRRA